MSKQTQNQKPHLTSAEIYTWCLHQDINDSFIIAKLESFADRYHLLKYGRQITTSIQKRQENIDAAQRKIISDELRELMTKTIIQKDKYKFMYLSISDREALSWARDNYNKLDELYETELEGIHLFNAPLSESDPFNDISEEIRNLSMEFFYDIEN